MKKIIGIILLLILSWGIFFTSFFLNHRSENNNLNFIPNNASVYAKIDLKNIISTTFNQVLSDSKNDKLLKNIKQKLSTMQEEKRGALGIDFLSDAVIFIAPYKKGKIVGISFNLLESDLFEKNIKNYIDKNQFSDLRKDKDVGFVYTFIPKDHEITYPISDIKNEFLKNIQFIHFPNSNEKSTEIASLIIKKSFYDPNSTFSNSIINIELKENSCIATGEFDLKNKYLTSYKSIKNSNSGLFLTTNLINTKLADSVKNLINNFGFNLPSISNLSLNYKGLNIENIDGEMGILPHLDLLISFNEKVNIDDQMIRFFNELNSVYTYDGKCLTCGKTKYYINQVDPFTISFSENKNLTITEEKSPFTMKGDLNTIHKIQGGEIFLSLLEMIPEYKMSKNFISTTEKINVSMKSDSRGKILFKGELLFKKGHYPTSELINLVLY